MMDEKREKAAASLAESGSGLGLLSLAVGLLTGGAAYLITDRYIDVAEPSALSVTVLQALVTFAASWLLLSERRDFIMPILPAAIIAALLAWPTFRFAGLWIDRADNLNDFPILFWGLAAAPLAFFLLLTLSKAALETGLPPNYTSLFFHGLTLPLVGKAAALFAGLALILLYFWAALLKQMDVEFFSRLFDEPWFVLPFLGAMGGVSISMIRGQQAVLGALRYILLLLARILTPIMAVFSITFLIALAFKGAGAIFDRPYPGAILIGLAFVGMLAFNGVYQNGQGEPPPLWLRISTIVALASLPIYSGLAAYAFQLRVSDYGLTPPRIAGLAMTMLAFAYSIVCLAALVSEIRWKSKRWMPLVAPLNTAMAVLWIATLLFISSPLFNSWSVSAKSQEKLLLSGRIAAKDFDFGYLKFSLGRDGEAALARLEAASEHPEAAAIRDGVARARAALSYWEYQHPELTRMEEPDPTPSDPTPETAPAQPGPLDLDFNPEGAPAEPAAPER
jgi:hypothetical protein